MKKFLYQAYRIYKRGSEDQINVYAAQSSFFIIISAIPLIMLLVTQVQFISPLSQSDLMNAILGIVPNSLNSYVVALVDELYNNASTAIISISALAILWSASKGTYALELGINKIYRSPSKRRFIIRRLWAVIYTAVFIVIVITTLLLLVFGNRIQLLLENMFPILSKITALIINLRSLFSVIFLSLFFALMYKALSHQKLKYSQQFPGAVFAALGWILFSFFYSIYIDNFSNYSYIYGSLTAVILLCLWLYVCMNILLIGAEINAWYNEHHI